MKHSQKDWVAKRLVPLLEPLATTEWFTPSVLPGVKFIRCNTSIPRAPCSYAPSIVIIAQGRKVGYVGDGVYVYDSSNYLVLSVPLPFDVETFASPEEPLLGVLIQVDATAVSEILLEIDDIPAVDGAVPRGICSTPLSDELTDATVRLLQSLGNARDARILGPQIIREIIYRVLCGEQGGALRQLAARETRFAQIARVLKLIHRNYDSKLDVETLARQANMSLSSFHSNFKAVTAASPLQYLKSVRLHKARMRLVQDGLNTTVVAGKVGYESTSQFCREFKRQFGKTPTADAAMMRKGIAIQ